MKLLDEFTQLGNLSLDEQRKLLAAIPHRHIGNSGQPLFHRLVAQRRHHLLAQTQHRLARRLSRRGERDHVLPGVDVHVFNKGVGGEDADEEVKRMNADVKDHKAQIVVWQVGTNSAIRRTPLDKFAAKLRDGIDIGRKLGPEFVLMNLQYVPAVVALPDEAMEKNVGLFRRFEIMRAWYNDGMPYAQFVTNDGLHLNDFGQKCIGKLLSLSILNSVKPPQLTVEPKPRN